MVVTKRSRENVCEKKDEAIYGKGPGTKGLMSWYKVAANGSHWHRV